MVDMNPLLEPGWRFDTSYTQLPELFYRRLHPTPVRSPELVILNHSLASSLGLNVQMLQSNDSVAVFAGNLVPEGASPLAQAYAGHQFGYFTMLGDGRAILIGEHMTPKNERYDIQLKGSGRTPYSRGGDGRAALGPMLREYIISEAMYALGIPTTRSLAVVTTGEKVFRETQLTGAILTRVATSHIRVGTFQFAARWGTVEKLRVLADYTIKRHFADIEADENRYLSFLKKVIERQAELITKWQLVGFIHGVMNTDNMAINGETIDYGPCAFMDTYDPATVFSSIDIQGRYAYGNQPDIAGWNLTRFAETLLPLLHDNQDQAVILAQEELSGFAKLYYQNWLSGMRSKLGLFNQEIEDITLIGDLLSMMAEYHADYTNTFRKLAPDELVEAGLFGAPEFKLWHQRWKARLDKQPQSKDASKALMQDSNPWVIPRNHRVEEALEAAEENGDYSVMKDLLHVLSNPYAYAPEQEKFALPPEPTSCRYKTFCGT